MSDNLSGMKKITARQFQKEFGKVSGTLKPGQSLQITKHGKPLGQFTRLAARRVKMPDFWANLRKLCYSTDLGDQILKEFNDALS